MCSVVYTCTYCTCVPVFQCVGPAIEEVRSSKDQGGKGRGLSVYIIHCTYLHTYVHTYVCM